MISMNQKITAVSSQRPSVKISLGAIQYFWDRNTLYEFYEAAAESSADIIYLGETVCGKRRSLSTTDWIELGKKLRETGKEVVLSSLCLIEAESELNPIFRHCKENDFVIEANDVAALNVASRSGVKCVAGTALNIYNSYSLSSMLKMGVIRWVPPVEIGREALSKIIGQFEGHAESPVETELLVYGRAPLAYSARCYTARLHDLAKDQCGLKCLEYPQGVPVYSQESEALFQINGIQTQASKITNLLSLWKQIRDTGVDVLRFSPNDIHTLSLLNDFAHQMGSNSDYVPHHDGADASAGFCNGYWFEREGMVYTSDSTKEM